MTHTTTTCTLSGVSILAAATLSGAHGIMWRTVWLMYQRFNAAVDRLTVNHAPVQLKAIHVYLSMKHVKFVSLLLCDAISIIQMFIHCVGLPDDTDRLIEALCLGNVQITLKIIPYELDLGTSVINTKRSSLRWCPETDGSKYICTEPPYTDGEKMFLYVDFTFFFTGKRSLAREYRRVTKLQKRSEPVPLPTDPIPYSSEEHSTRFRRQSNPQCSSNDNQFILYLLDTSGSIGESDFNLTRDAIAKLIPLFCKDIQVAVMTFNHQFKLEFCFNCYGRGEVGNAIKDIIYRGGGTNTAGASKCACDELLTPQCGLDCDANCIDVVYITDGGSNDPSLEVCEEVKCLHNHVRGVNVHVVGIGSYNQNELNCIENSSRGISLFKYDTAADFNQAIGDVAAKLQRFSSTYQCTCANK